MTAGYKAKFKHLGKLNSLLTHSVAKAKGRPFSQQHQLNCLNIQQN